MDLALLVLRLVVGLLFVGHGAQKLFGVFGGGGLQSTAGMFDSIGLRPGLAARPGGPAPPSSWAAFCSRLGSSLPSPPRP